MVYLSTCDHPLEAHQTAAWLVRLGATVTVLPKRPSDFYMGELSPHDVAVLQVGLRDDAPDRAFLANDFAGSYRDIFDSNLHVNRMFATASARAAGFGRVAIWDHDISPKTGQILNHLAAGLDQGPISGATSSGHRDESDVGWIQARRDGHGRRGPALSGNCLAFVPWELHGVFVPMYGEDYGFFLDDHIFGDSDSASALVLADEVVQAPLRDRSSPRRARFQEFGDTVMDEVLEAATWGGASRLWNRNHWEGCFDRRERLLQDLIRTNRLVPPDGMEDAVESALRAALGVHPINPQHGVDFMRAWRQYRIAFAGACPVVGPGGRFTVKDLNHRGSTVEHPMTHFIMEEGRRSRSRPAPTGPRGHRPPGSPPAPVGSRDIRPNAIVAGGKVRATYRVIHGSSDTDVRTPLVIIIPGTADRAERWAPLTQLLQSVGVTSAVIDLSGDRALGMRTSWEQSTIAEHAGDVRAVFDELITLPTIDLAKVMVHGHSYGALLAVELTAERAFGHLVLQAPVLLPDDALHRPRLRKLTKEERARLARFQRNPHGGPGENLRTLRLLGEFPGTFTLVAHRWEDEMPPAIPESYWRAGAHPPGADRVHAQRLTADARHSEPYRDWIHVFPLLAHAMCRWFVPPPEVLGVPSAVPADTAIAVRQSLPVPVNRRTVGGTALT